MSLTKGLVHTLIPTFFYLLLIYSVVAIDESDFKKCSQAGFCRRGRALAARAEATGTTWKSPYAIDPSSVAVAPNQAFFFANVKSSLYPDIKFKLEVRIHVDGVARVRMDEADGLRKRYDEAASWALIEEPQLNQDVQWKLGKKNAKAIYGVDKELQLVVSFEPLKVSLLRKGKEQVVLNGRGLLHMEHFRVKKESPPEERRDGEENAAQKVVEVNKRAWFEGEEEDDYWEETWQSWTDSKPKGPESLSIDISFPNHFYTYGIPQHATRLALPTTSGSEAYYSDPYRLYNADTPDYLTDSPMGLYGSIPLMHAHSSHSTVAIFNAVASETWVDVAHPSIKATNTHWISESGILDLFLLPGPTPADIFAQYARLTGTPVIPAHWALGYHQCRWNYVTSDDIRTVQKRLDQDHLPFDVLWLDIEYSEDRNYFIWEKKRFPDPVEMIKDVEALSRKMVVIVDPHLKPSSDYPVYRDASRRQVLVKPKSGEGEFNGLCWPGTSVWVDFFNPNSWDWWKNIFKTTKLDDQFSWEKSTESVHIWNDMNEPSVFDGPELSMPRDNIHYGGWEHRDVHNLNGMLYSNTTYLGLLERSNPPKRPFVLTRSFYAGSQRAGAMWTGDTKSEWGHMSVGIRMALVNSIAGMSFGGGDVGGFSGNPDPEMLVRWYQVGAFGPFFRAHAHIDTKRREPYLLNEPYKSIVRDTLRLRYSLLPVWYTAFRETTVTGVPVLRIMERPQYVVFPHDEAGFAIDDQFFLGSSGLLVKPVTAEGVNETTVYLSEDQIYYDFFTSQAYHGAKKGKYVTVSSALHQIPLFMQGGSILPTRDRPRRSSPLMFKDPFTLRVALDRSGKANGELYLDDGESYKHREGELVWRGFSAETTDKILRVSSRDLATERPDQAVEGIALAKYDSLNAFARDIDGVRVERIVIKGVNSRPKRVHVEGGEELGWEYSHGLGHADGRNGATGILVIRDPKVKVIKDWAIVVQL